MSGDLGGHLHWCFFWANPAHWINLAWTPSIVLFPSWSYGILEGNVYSVSFLCGIRWVEDLFDPKLLYSLFWFRGSWFLLYWVMELGHCCWRMLQIISVSFVEESMQCFVYSHTWIRVFVGRKYSYTMDFLLGEIWVL